jgi:hypothetical protein
MRDAAAEAPPRTTDAGKSKASARSSPAHRARGPTWRLGVPLRRQNAAGVAPQGRSPFSSPQWPGGRTQPGRRRWLPPCEPRPRPGLAVRLGALATENAAVGDGAAGSFYLPAATAVARRRGLPPEDRGHARKPRPRPGTLVRRGAPAAKPHMRHRRAAHLRL